jgi:hypothetical protein
MLLSPARLACLVSENIIVGSEGWGSPPPTCYDASTNPALPVPVVANDDCICAVMAALWRGGSSSAHVETKPNPDRCIRFSSKETPAASGLPGDPSSVGPAGRPQQRRACRETPAASGLPGDPRSVGPAGRPQQRQRRACLETPSSVGPAGRPQQRRACLETPSSVGPAGRPQQRRACR